MGGGKGGGKGGGGIDVQPSPYEQAMANIANQYYGATAPLRGYFLEDYGNFLRPGGVAGGTVTPGTSGLSYYNPTPYSGGTVTTGTSGLAAYNPLANVVNKNIVPSLTPSADRLPSPWMYNSTDALPSANPAYYQGLQDIMGYQGSQINNLQAQLNKAASTTPSPGQAGTSGLASSARYNPYNLPGYAPLYQLARAGTESQYNQARANILGSTPRGGALAENLGSLEMARAQQAGALPAQIASPLIQDIMNKAYGVAFGAPAQSMSGLGGAASAYTGTQQAALQAQALGNQQAMGLGAGLGQLAGLGIKAALK